ncbi:unnamed protein product [Phytophthora fragariaefolia]|uniref:Unnamed protein product n=1 Tax=Phytophthora fragariaefolia TaxID=1490495 RepID=A0A9W6X2T3_9STRA|nr:unnamed protein product [Phytophthora fragariaefolia]
MPSRIACVGSLAEGGSIPETTPSATKTRCLHALLKLEDGWNRIQVGRQGSYSVERLESLDHYCKTTSPTRVLLVCILTPVPALTFALLLECLPLRPPSEGWAANWMFWVRLSVMVLGLTFVGVSELILFLPNLNFTNNKRIIVTIGATIPYVGTCIIAAKFGGFPVPFVWQYGGMTLVIYIAAMTLLVFGRQPFAKNSSSRRDFRRFLYHLFAYCAMVGIFPLFETIYRIVPEQYRVIALVVLPIWKLGAKHFVIRVTYELEDFIPEMVAFTVDFFSALFVSVCISSGGSIHLSMLFIAADVAQVVIEFQEVRTNAKTVLKLLQCQLKPTFQHQRDLTEKVSISNNLVEMLLAVTRNPKAFHVVLMRDIRLWACLPHPLTEDRANKLKLLRTSGVYAGRRVLSRRRTSRFRPYRQWFAPRIVQEPSVVPIRCETSTHFSAIQNDLGDFSQTFVRQGLQLLFHCEYLLLVEYVECIVPVIFATYKSVLECLPNIIYYPGGAGHWSHSALINIFVFTSLEIASLMLLHRFLHRNFALSSLYQLAFVLEAQMYPIQATIFLEIVNLLQYKLEHLGESVCYSI